MKWKLDIFRFDNGNVAVCNEEGQQVAELQGTDIEAIPKIIKWLENKLRTAKSLE